MGEFTIYTVQFKEANYKGKTNKYLINKTETKTILTIQYPK